MHLTDWDILRQACFALISGQNPYLIGQGELRFFNPIWTLIPLLPIAFLPSLVGLIVNAVISMVALAFITRRLNLTIWEFFWIAISPIHINSMIFGNIEWLPLMGILFPSPVAMIFYAMKPQATAGLIVLTLAIQWKTARLKGLLCTLAPTFVLMVVSLVLWGLPPIPSANNPGLRSLFPFSLLAGIPALILALQKKDMRLAAFVGPFISPYVTFHGYLPALFPFRGKWLIFAVLISFIPVILGYVN